MRTRCVKYYEGGIRVCNFSNLYNDDKNFRKVYRLCKEDVTIVIKLAWALNCKRGRLQRYNVQTERER